MRRGRVMARKVRRGWVLLAAPLAVAGCALPPPQPRKPMPMPAVGAKVPVQADKVKYTVIRSDLASAPRGYVLKVYRADPPPFDFAQGLAAKRAVTAYCAGLNRSVAANSQGMFEATGDDWAFPGGCT